METDQLDRADLADSLAEDAAALYDERETELGDELMRALERYLLLQIIDQRWREHLYDMDYLREGIHLRGFAQIDPLVAYKNEAFDLFTDLMNTIWSDFARMIFHVEVEVDATDGDGTAARRRRSGSRAAAARRARGACRTRAASARPSRARLRQPRRAARPAGRRPWVPRATRSRSSTCCRSSSSAASTRTEQIGRNDPCWCGSGKKFKKCHGA